MAITTTSPVVLNSSTIVGKGTQTFLNITSATVVKSMQGRVAKVSVISPSDAGNQYAAVADHASTSGLSNANLIAVIPDVRGVYDVDMPCSTGIVLAPGGAGQVLAISFS